MLSEIMPVVLYFLVSALVIILIVLSLKLIITINKVNDIMDNVEKKVESLDGLFNIVDVVTDKMSFLTDALVSSISSLITRLFTKKKGDEDCGK